MTAKLAEPCRTEPLKLTTPEDNQRTANLPDATCLPAHLCIRDAFLGLFFDGTNNNKYRDLPKRAAKDEEAAKTNSASNVARLFEAFSGGVTPIHANYAGEKDIDLKRGVADGQYTFYRKIYIPGLGTAFSEIKDPGENLAFWDKIKRNKVPTPLGDKTRGLAMAMHGEARIRWALLQVLEQVQRMLKPAEALNSAELITKWSTEAQDDSLLNAALKLTPLGMLGDSLIKLLGDDFDDFFNDSLEKLSKNLKDERKKIRSIRLSIFGFSRGAAEARAFANRLLKLAPNNLGGIPYQIDFMGIFDTVASVGLANLTPGADGHMAWADGDALKIPAAVKRCVHLVAAHEIRRCFPLDAMGVSNSKYLEVVYPGVHSDVGGGYPPLDQGRCKDDSEKISQISLAQMYREARMMGVPLAAETDMPTYVSRLFTVSPKLRQVFNEYIKRTQCAPQLVTKLIEQQYSHYLAWRKYRLNNIIPPGWLKGAKTEIQDIYDLKQTNEILQKIELDGKERPFHRTGLALWKKAQLDPNKDKAIIDLFDLYVHDSRAWFKLAGDTDDEWFGGGKDASGKPRPSLRDAEQEKEQARLARLKSMRSQRQKRIEELKALQAKRAKNMPPPILGGLSADDAGKAELRELDIQIAQSEARLRQMNEKWASSGGKPLINDGKSSQEGVDFGIGKVVSMVGAGYLTMRDIYPFYAPPKVSSYLNPNSVSSNNSSSYPAALQR